MVDKTFEIIDEYGKSDPVLIPTVCSTSGWKRAVIRRLFVELGLGVIWDRQDRVEIPEDLMMLQARPPLIAVLQPRNDIGLAPAEALMD